MGYCFIKVSCTFYAYFFDLYRFFKFLYITPGGYAIRKGKGGVFCKEKVKDCKEKEKGVGVYEILKRGI